MSNLSSMEIFWSLLNWTIRLAMSEITAVNCVL